MTTVSGYRSGFQGLNRMFGPTHQLPCGEFVLIGGLTHNYKTELLHVLLRHAATETRPDESVGETIPTLLFFMGTGTASSEILRLFAELKEDETGETVDPDTYNTTEIVDYVNARLASMGWHVGILDLSFKDVTVADLRDIVEDYVKLGHDVKVAFIDDIASTLIHDDLRALIGEVRDFMKGHQILTIATHPFSVNMMKRRRELGDGFLTQMPESNIWAGDSRLSQEVDLEVFVNIIQRGDDYYLELQRGKHRTLPITPEEDRHTYIPFTATGHLPSDVEGEDRSMSVLPE